MYSASLDSEFSKYNIDQNSTVLLLIFLTISTTFLFKTLKPRSCKFGRLHKKGKIADVLYARPLMTTQTIPLNTKMYFSSKNSATEMTWGGGADKQHKICSITSTSSSDTQVTDTLSQLTHKFRDDCHFTQPRRVWR